MKQIPEHGIDRAQLLTEMAAYKQLEGDVDWRHGRGWSLVYYAGEEHTRLLNDVYKLYFTENGLSSTAFPSLRKFEAEVVSMILNLLGATGGECGTMTSGGTESILLAMKSYRDQARTDKPEIHSPEILVPESAHPAFLKAAQYFGLRTVPVPLDNNFHISLTAVEERISDQTICIVASAPCYPHGVIDPITEIGELTMRHDVGLHVDACLGGFLLPFFHKLGRTVRCFDFSVPGVTSISADLHKNGYAAKGASAVFYRTPELRRHQYFISSDWPGGLYGSPTMLGTRPGGAIAAAWAAMMSLGEDGYTNLARRALQVTDDLLAGIRTINGLKVFGEPDMTVITFGSDVVNIFAVADKLDANGWRIDRQRNPDCIHLIATPNHAQSVIPFLTDLKSAVDAELRNPTVSNKDKTTMLYGVTASVPDDGDLDAFMRRSIDVGYSVP
ncbi:MAG TPA: aspartate aminotransferase family protein [Gammaproteobacteria bacterium]|nr:aspartate aminotransferase family protein [Gammaproteobacteria bacterium]